MDKKDAAIYKALEKIKEATVVAKPAKKPTIQTKPITKAPIAKVSGPKLKTAKPAKKPTIQTKPITKAPIAKVSTGGHLKPVKK